MKNVLKNWDKFKKELGQMDWATHYSDFVNRAEKRLKLGAKLYKDSWKTQDNLAEALEEALDIAVYCYLETEKQNYKPDDKRYQVLVECGIVALRNYTAIKDLMELR